LTRKHGLSNEKNENNRKKMIKSKKTHCIANTSYKRIRDTCNTNIGWRSMTILPLSRNIRNQSRQPDLLKPIF